MRCIKKHVLINILFTVLFLSGLPSCSDDDSSGSYPSMKTELVEAYTGSDKNVKSIQFDDGRSYDLSQSISSSTADTLMRCVCSYTYKEDTHHLTVYSLGVVCSNYPTVSDSIPAGQAGNYKLISSWCSSRYINAYISYQTTDQGTHRFYFIEDSLKTYPDGSRTSFVSLFHEQPPKDPESYTKKIYVSLPTYYYQNKADTVHLCIGGKIVTALSLGN